MSEIPFVNALGDAIEQSAARFAAAGGASAPPHRVGVLAFAVAATGVAAASGVFESGPPEQLATTNIGCYSRADLEHADVAVIGVDAPDPVEACRSMLKRRGADGRVRRSAVMVFPGGPGTCEKLGLKPLPPEYGPPARRCSGSSAASPRSRSRRTAGRRWRSPHGCRSCSTACRRGAGTGRGS